MEKGVITMQALSGIYENGNFTVFGESIPENIKKARLYIVVIPEEEGNKNYIPMDNFRITQNSSEEDFKMLGLQNFFSSEEDDQGVDWEECFGIK